MIILWGGALEDNDISDDELKKAIGILVDTEKYINNFDVNEYIQIGIDYQNEIFQVSLAEEESDAYNIDVIDSLFEKYENVDRKRALAGIFNKIVGEETNNTKRHEKVLDFLAKGILHNPKRQPLTREGDMMFDPIVLLELHDMRCGNTNRIGCDLFSSVGYETRVVQLYHHQIGEIYYDGQWHYFDADTILNSDDIVKINGIIPSINELSNQPYLIDKVNFCYDEIIYNTKLGWEGQWIYPSYVFTDTTGDDPVYYCKNATDIESLNDFYGWNYYDTVSNDGLNILDSYFCQPGIPYIDTVAINDNICHIEYTVEDYDNDLMGYVIYVSNKSREWEYLYQYCTNDVKKYILNQYMPAQYDNINKLPPSDVLIDTTVNNYCDLHLSSGTYYVSIMGFDQHGLDIGKRWYKPSNELVIKIQ